MGWRVRYIITSTPLARIIFRRACTARDTASRLPSSPAYKSRGVWCWTILNSKTWAFALESTPSSGRNVLFGVYVRLVWTFSLASSEKESDRKRSVNRSRIHRKMRRRSLRVPLTPMEPLKPSALLLEVTCHAAHTRISLHTLLIFVCLSEASLTLSWNSSKASACRNALCLTYSLHILAFKSAGGFMSESSKRCPLIVAFSPRAWSMQACLVVYMQEPRASTSTKTWCKFQL